MASETRGRRRKRSSVGSIDAASVDVNIGKKSKRTKRNHRSIVQHSESELGVTQSQPIESLVDDGRDVDTHLHSTKISVETVARPDILTPPSTISPTIAEQLRPSEGVDNELDMAEISVLNAANTGYSSSQDMVVDTTVVEEYETAKNDDSLTNKEKSPEIAVSSSPGSIYEEGIITGPDEGPATGASVVVYPNLIIPDPTRELEIKLFEDVLTEKSHEVAELQAKVDIFSTELHALGFANTDTDPLNVLATARATFRQARQHLEAVYPELETSELQNGELVRRLVEEIGELAATLKDQSELLRRVKEREETHKVKLSHSRQTISINERRITDLEGQWTSLDKIADLRLKQVVELHEVIQGLQNNLKELEVTCDEQEEEIAEVVDVANEKAANNKKLQQTLDDVIKAFDSETKRLKGLHNDQTDLITRLEADHERAMSDFNNELEVQTAALEAAESATKDKVSIIETLEDDLNDANQVITGLNKELQAALAELEEQKTRSGIANNELEQRIADITALQIRVEVLEGDKEELSSDLERLQNLVDKERNHREKAETDLDDRNEEVVALEARLREAGHHSNELKSKLFEAQERRKNDIAALQQEADQNEATLQDELDAEHTSRVSLEEHVTELDRTIAELEQQIEDTTDELKHLQASRDKEFEERSGRIKDLEIMLQEQKATHVQFAEKKGQEVDVLQGDLATLTHDLGVRDNTIFALQNTLIEARNNSQEVIDEQSGKIASLEETLGHVKTRLSAVEQTKASLEKRVETNAMELLETQYKHADEKEEFEGALLARDKAIGMLSDEKQKLQAQYETDVRIRDDNIQALESISTERAEDVEYLIAQVDQLEDRNAETLIKAREAMENMHRRQIAVVAEDEHERDLFEEFVATTVASTTNSPARVAVSEHLLVGSRASRSSKTTTKKTKQVSRASTAEDSAVFDLTSFEDEGSQAILA